MNGRYNYSFAPLLPVDECEERVCEGDEVVIQFSV